MSFHCFIHGEAPDGAFSCPKCAAGWIGETPPPGWKQCPHCMGSGLVQADDLRVTTSPVSFQDTNPHE